MVMQIRRTTTANNPPTALAEGQLAVEMASDPPKLWCGVPTAIDASGRIRIAPLDPRVGDVRFDSGKLEQFDGSAWVEIPLGGGPHMGVTDGSNAVPGEVGEWRTSTFSVAMNTNPFTGIAGTIVLPAGDWHTWVRVAADIGGFNPNPIVAPTGFVNPTMYGMSGGNQAYARFMPGLTWDTGLNAYTQVSGSITFGPVRTTSAAPDTIYCQMAMRLTGIPAAGNFTGACNGEFWARRMR